LKQIAISVELKTLS